MTDETTKVHHATRRAADKDLSEGIITEQAHATVLAGAMDLTTARNIGVDDAPTDTTPDSGGRGDARTTAREAQEDYHEAPAGPRLTSRISKDDHLSPCLCGCGKLVKNRFAAGHDMRMFRVAREHLEQGRELTDEQREYLETSGKMQRVRARLAEEERKASERVAARETKAKSEKK